MPTLSLLDPSHFAPIFLPMQGKRIGYVQGQHGNAGDALIHHATLRLFAAFEIPYVILNEPPWPRQGAITQPEEVDEAVLFGGGSMGAPLSGGLRAKVRSWNLPVTLLPQSWRAPEEAPYHRVFVRETGSLQYCPSARFAPDLALAYSAELVPEPPSEDCGLFLRQDEEGLFRDRSSCGDPAAGLGRLDAKGYLRRAAKYRRIVTDRLHFAIAGLLLKREVVLLPNSYHKNRGTFEASLAALGCGWADQPEEAIRPPHRGAVTPSTTKHPRKGEASVVAVILNWKRPENIPLIVSALRQQTVPCSITLCDASPEGSEFELPAAVRQSADIWYRFGRNYGSLNRFIPAFGYMEEFLFYQDDDLLPGPRALEHLLESAAQRPRFAVLGEKGRILHADGKYRWDDVPRHRTELVPVDFIIRAGLVRTENLRSLDWFRRRMNLQFGQEPDLLREDDLLLCTAIQTKRQLPCFLIPIGENHPETALFQRELPAPHSLAKQNDHCGNRTRFLREARLAGWRSLRPM